MSKKSRICYACRVCGKLMKLPKSVWMRHIGAIVPCAGCGGDYAIVQPTGLVRYWRKEPYLREDGEVRTD